MSFDSTIHAKAIGLTKFTYDITAAAGSGHPTSGASLSHLISVLMYQHMRYEPVNPKHPAADRLVLSEGHAVPIVYAACADQGVMIGKSKETWRPMTREDALTLRHIDSMIDGHPNPVEGFPFFDTATGSLGQGLSQSAGLALAARLDGLNKRIFCIIGDGESREGQIWEAVDFIVDQNLKAVCPIFNCNGFAQSSHAAAQQSPETTALKLEAVGYDVKLIDGHNPTAIREALQAHAAAHAEDAAAPVAIVAKTVKGWGAASQQGNGHHGQAPKGEALARVQEELDETFKSMGAHADFALKIGMMSPRTSTNKDVTKAPTFPDAIKEFGLEADLKKNKMATRKAYGIALRALGRANPDVVALDADVQGSTFASMFAQDETLADRFIECRIAEQNMVSVAAGLYAGGKVPYCSTFAKFFTRAYDQIEMGFNGGAAFKLVGSHAGVSLGADGPSQMAMPDVAWFRAFTTMRRNDHKSGFYLLQPSDAYQAYALVQQAAAYDGPCYIRTTRPDTTYLYTENDSFTLGGHEVLREGRDVLIVASGFMVHQGLAAVAQLKEQGVDPTLVDLYSIPFDSEAILDLANENNGVVITIEDNYGGGIGSAVADAVAADGGGFTVHQMHVNHLPKSGLTTEDLMKYTGLSVDDIVSTTLGLLQVMV